jgi:hypothetical protein
MYTNHLCCADIDSRFLEFLVSIHILRTIVFDYFGLLVYLTWLLHIGLRFETCLVPQFFGRMYYVRH